MADWSQYEIISPGDQPQAAPQAVDPASKWSALEVQPSTTAPGSDNAVARVARFLLNLAPGPEGYSGSPTVAAPGLGEAMRADTQAAGQGAQSLVSGAIAATPLPEATARTPQALASAALSPEAARLAAETGGAILGASAGVPEAAVLGRFAPAAARIIGAAAGGALGSVAAEPAAPTASPLAHAAAVAASSGIAQGAAEAVPVAAKGLKKLANRYVPNATQTAYEFVNSFLPGASREDAGQLLINTFEDANAAFDETARAKFANLDQMTAVPSDVVPGTYKLAGAPVDVNGALDKALEMARREKNNPLAKKYLGYITKAIEDGSRGDGTLTFAEAHQLYTDIAGSVPTGMGDVVSIPSQESGSGRVLSKMVRRAMEDSADAIGPQARAAFEDAQSFWQSGKEAFNSGMASAVVKRDPELVAKALRSATPEGVARAKGMLEATDPQGWNAVKTLVGQDLLAASSPSGDLLGARMYAAVNKPYGDFGPEKLQAIFGADGAETLTKIARTLRRTDLADRALSLSWKDGLRIGMRTALGSGIGYSVGGKEGALTGLAISLSPEIAVKALTNPTIARLIERGAAAAPGSRMATTVLAQIAAATARLSNSTESKSTPSSGVAFPPPNAVPPSELTAP